MTRRPGLGFDAPATSFFSRFIALCVLPEHRDAQLNLLDTKLAAAHRPESRLNAAIGLYQVLGGGWHSGP
ncbi:hypothetical protein M0M42_05810 [Pseudomonas knackmussii]|uniref:Uncharacterized protein n=1 Tax=Pseudomonas knackmussii TaxID=65741 RepID=A0ABY4KUP9_9PSED|nr:hypothetical protein [Pseudomonas knackmussii]UPQ83921.1 hypothetical protein M0M42_05810 [Pseudomonas knackmussii]